MAFSLQYLQRVYSSVDLNKVSNPTVGESVGIGPSVWTYSAAATGGSNDSAATVEASGYFNGATGYVSNGDMIYAVTMILAIIYWQLAAPQVHLL